MLKGRFHHTKNTPQGKEIWEHHSKEDRIILKWVQDGKTCLLKANYVDDGIKVLNFTGTEIGQLEREFKNCILLRKQDIIKKAGYYRCQKETMNYKRR